MVEAYVKRQAERQELLRELMQTVYNVEEGAGNAESMGEEERIEFKLDVIQVIAAHLKQRVYPQDRPDNIDRFASSFFFRDDILSRVGEFSRAEEENEWLMIELMGKLKESVNSYLHGKLAKLEQSNPQQIFQAPSAMTEVSLNP